MENKDNLNPAELQSHAWNGVLKFAGSILVLSVAFKNIGLDFTPVMQALTANIAHTMDSETCSVEFDARLKIVEDLAHKGKVPH